MVRFTVRTWTEYFHSDDKRSSSLTIDNSKDYLINYQIISTNGVFTHTNTSIDTMRNLRLYDFLFC